MASKATRSSGPITHVYTCPKQQEEGQGGARACVCARSHMVKARANTMQKHRDNATVR